MKVEMQEVTQEYVDQSITDADLIYTDVVRQAKLNETVGVTWISRHFPVNWYGASHIINRMEKEELCEPYQGNKPRKVFCEKEGEDE
jgi:hypothetical protein